MIFLNCIELQMNKEILSLRPCPWCKRTPRFSMYLNQITWTPTLRCEYHKCQVKPESQHVNIRKGQKYDPSAIRQKIIRLFNSWNTGNDYTAYEGKEFDWVEIAKNEIKIRDQLKEQLPQ